ncbi:hypothetical protein BOX15_Mlig031223g1 [Macrostomum lignano]|uniref:Kazal-like domain-containing protein n=2 Tax=Macrostomum lignano TaxID=282301 RepID=A0A267DQZ8_9PLAT|nr:hypothetical protein BOX15_Mlig031223g2 [Macrostomum lignano]PAA73644.1 hypothetical protein BOX15_Mlig031223g1 [Macrostomum lignano]
MSQHRLLLLLTAALIAAASAAPCFIYRGWKNPCHEVTCPDNAQCVPALNMHKYKCTCPTDCWDIGDSDDSGQVCGSDGITYESLCHLQRASCHAAVMVTPVYRGVCDPCVLESNGRRRSVCPQNQRCVLDALRRPRCECNYSCDRIGPDAGDLVCASNGVTYSDQCRMNHDACLRGVNTTKLSTGECPTGKYCTECRHPYQRCRVENELTGVSTCHCPESCPPVLSPVCGSDNNTYESLCHLYRHACLNNLPPKQLLPVHRGSCSREGLCGRGRSQPCLFGGVCRVRIEEKLMSHHQISYSGKFACDPPECLWSETPDDAEPAGDRWLLAVILSAAGGEFSAQVCGTDGVTYKSECHLRRRAFELRRDIRVSERSSCNPCRKVTCPHFGLCRVNSRGQPQCHCPTNCLYSPGETSVCGSDGRIHDSGCELRRTSCRTKQDIQILPIEMCGQGAAGRRRRGNKEKRSVDRGRQQHQHRLRHYRKRSFLVAQQ